MIIGKIVKSNSHIDYLCRVNDTLDTPQPPGLADYTFGRFVRMIVPPGQQPSDHIVGIIYNSQLVNPEFGNYGPRLTTPPDQNAVFSPDYVNEQFTLIGILLLGWLNGNGGIHRIPPTVIPLNITVETLPEDEVRTFHLNDRNNLHLNYYSHVINHAGKLGPQLMQNILEQLNRLFGADYQPTLDILKDTLSWQVTMATLK